MHVPKYSKHSSGQARVRLGGKVYYLGPYGSKASKAKYKQLVSEWTANGGVIVTESDKTNLTLSDLFLSYVTWARNNYGPRSTEFDKVRRIVRLTKASYATIEAAKFGYQQFEVIRQKLIGQGVGRKYVNASMDRLVRIFNWGVSRELVPPNTATVLVKIERLQCGRTIAPEPVPVLPVDDSVVVATLPHLPEIVADMVRLQSVVGCRPIEVCGLKPSMIDRSTEVWEVHIKKHKTARFKKDRTLYIGPRGQEILAKYLLRDADSFCFQPVESERKRRKTQHEQRVTPLNQGDRPGTNRKPKPKRRPRDHYDTPSYRRAIHRACDKAFPVPEGMNDRDARKWRSDHRWSPNQIRHSFGTLARKHEGLETAAILLGHSDVKTTLIYAEADREKAREAALRIG